ncbi:hypothetical protein FHS99_001352 [Sphingomonas prati]|uniref:Uncharacterized protein n=1 Tax=Sphingomonas prati TaxID=1843237 RepID=A0A7W9BS10_9SPHN|nr:hypothetical protein [Sphingomonas prati]
MPNRLIGKRMLRNSVRGLYAIAVAWQKPP